MNLFKQAAIKLISLAEKAQLQKGQRYKTELKFLNEAHRKNFERAMKYIEKYKKSPQTFEEALNQLKVTSTKNN